ncbi:ScbR family autoregulator-binding transcription factor [Streptomyces sp. NPDC102406]|uniref:ScbR family autoregulator-binding transcription factor n=1 Tax=Streptomyces sp. NPDC102406 TaxID=3366171 RepID=UPI0038134F3C
MKAKQDRSVRTLERLITSAAEQFADRGFIRATLSDVSVAAGVTKGALFFHFATKDELADAVQARGEDVCEAVIRGIARKEEVSLQVLVDATHELNRLLREDPFVRAGVRIARERTSEAAAPSDFYPLWLGRLWDLLDEARRKDELDGQVADRSARTLVTAAVCGVEVLASMGVPADEGDQWLAGLWELFLPLLLPPGEPNRLRA